MSRYSEAEGDLIKAAKVDPHKENIKTLKAHVAAALGKEDEAMQLLNATRAQAEVNTTWLLAVAEAYLVVSPSDTVGLLDANPDVTKEFANIAAFLKAFGATLLGLDKLATDNLTILRKSESSLSKENWDVTELKEFMKWGKARGQLTEAQNLTLTKLLSDSGWADLGPGQQLHLSLPEGQVLTENRKDQDID